MKQLLLPELFKFGFNQSPVSLIHTPFKPIIERGLSGVIPKQHEFYYFIPKYENKQLSSKIDSKENQNIVEVKELGEIPTLYQSKKRKSKNADVEKVKKNKIRKSNVKLIS